MGKSLYIKRLREALETQTRCQPVEVVIPIHGPVVTADTVVDALIQHFGNTRATIFHLDIAPNVCNSYPKQVVLYMTIFIICLIGTVAGRFYPFLFAGAPCFV